MFSAAVCAALLGGAAQSANAAMKTNFTSKTKKSKVKITHKKDGKTVVDVEGTLTYGFKGKASFWNSGIAWVNGNFSTGADVFVRWSGKPKLADRLKMVHTIKSNGVNVSVGLPPSFSLGSGGESAVRTTEDEKITALEYSFWGDNRARFSGLSTSKLRATLVPEITFRIGTKSKTVANFSTSQDACIKQSLSGRYWDYPPCF